MAVPIKMPQLGESVTEGTVGTWLKKPGDQVEKYEPLLEVISDKVDTEITATDSGTLISIEVEEGETVPVGTVLCYLGEEGEAVGDGGEPAAEEPAPAPEPEPEPQPASEGEPEPEPVAQRAPAREEAAPAQAEAAPSEGPPMITPVVARMIAEHNIDISQVEGTGRDGRVTKRDIEAFMEEQEKEPAPTPAPARPSPAPEVPPRAEPARPAPAPAARRPEVEREPARPSAPRGPAVQPGELIPMTNMRRRIAEHMVESKRTAPHVTTVFEADLSAISRHRNANRDEFEARGIRLTYMAYFVEAVAYALRQHPMANSSFTEDGIQLFKDINVGMAAATEGGAGLLVPVIKNADEKNLSGLARDVQDLTERARSGNLTPDDMSGGTFTITNHGVYGSLWGTPIINQPQSAILGLGKIQKRVIVTEDDTIAIRPMVYLSFTFDHRVLDGATADTFMQDVIEYLENYG